MVKYGYARVSGMTQDLTDQVAALEAQGCSVVYREKYTGTKKERPKFMNVLEILAEGDTLVVTKLDRFARSAEDGITLIKSLLKRGVSVHILNMGVVEDTPIGCLLLTVMSGFAELERDLIVERLTEGKAIAKQREGYQEGRPNKYTKAQMAHAMTLLETHSYTEVERITTISKTTLTRHKRKLIKE